MSFSMKQVLDMLADPEEDIIDNIGFILTVFRDNCNSDSDYIILDKILKRL